MATQPHDDHDGRDDIGDSPRPSFTKFWKRLRSKPGPRRNNNFVSVNPAAPDGRGPRDGGEGGGDASKAEARRAQVRRAQIQHRERKANYAKGLEADIVRLRGDIELCRTDCRRLAGDNQGDAAAADGLCGCRYGGDTFGAGAGAPSYSFDFDPGCVVSLNVNESLGSPSFQAHWRTTAGYEAPADFTETSQTLDPASEKGERCLEHTCWDHFKEVDFQLRDTDQPPAMPAVTESVTGDIDHDPDHGHTLMLSAMALQQAPESVVQSLENRNATCGAASSTNISPRAPYSAKTDGSITWPVTGLTLESLHGLASALNPPDLELTPVQAWFEMVREYGSRAVLEEDNDGSVLDRLVAELRGGGQVLELRGRHRTRRIR
ncbi:uncharacterized protein PG998_000507 [Apiospora kogelbergensis]|uniref:uncharacterized protein n=1 Tax=Apiospora kogelbergensis TaxID=1337665 RepID=UPI00312FE70E